MIDFIVNEFCDVIRNVIDDNTAIVNHIVTRTTSPASITQEEFEEFVKEHTEFNHEYSAWIFSHPELGEVVYDIDDSEIDFDDVDDYEKLVGFDEFLVEVAEFLWTWGVEILFSSIDETDIDINVNTDAMKEMTEEQDQYGFIEENTSSGR